MHVDINQATVFIFGATLDVLSAQTKVSIIWELVLLFKARYRRRV
jgi:hypothetical protein